MIPFFQQWFLIFSESPTLRLMQMALLAVGALAVFLVFFTLRDITLRSRSFWYQTFSILLVAGIPIVGFFLYLLIRPGRTLKDRDMHALLLTLLSEKGIVEGEEGLFDTMVKETEDVTMVSEPETKNLFIRRPLGSDDSE